MNEYGYEYYSQKTYSTNMNSILDTLCHKYEKEYYVLRIFTNIFENLNIFEYLKINKFKVTATYQIDDCGQDIKTFFVTFHTTN